MFKAEKVGDLSGSTKQVAAAIRTVYSVGYYPTNPEGMGPFAALEWASIARTRQCEPERVTMRNKEKRDA